MPEGRDLGVWGEEVEKEETTWMGLKRYHGSGEEKYWRSRDGRLKVKAELIHVGDWEDSIGNEL
jgi:hypothetical protein